MPRPLLLRILGVALLWRHLRARLQAEAAPGDGLGPLRQQWQAAMIGVRAARRQRQVVPWYVVLGPAGGGKSTLLATSGLTLTSSADEIGDTPTGAHLTLWHHDAAVFIEVGDALGQPGWLALLRLICRARSGLPLQGVLIVKPLAEQFRKGLPAAALEANLMRERLQGISDITGTVVPVHLVVTKADLLGGCKEFFASAERVERESVLGLTMAWPGDNEVVAGFSAEYGRLLDRLSDRRLAALSAAASETAQRKLLQFPAQLRAALPFLTDFLAIAARPSPGTSTGFRGLAFTSIPPQPKPSPTAKATTGEAAPPKSSMFISRSFAAAAKAAVGATAGTPAAPGGATPGANVPAVAFVRGLFSQRVLPDAGLVAPTPRAQRRWRLQRIASLGVAPLVALLLIAWTGWSTWRGVQLVDGLRQPFQALNDGERGTSSDATTRLLALDQLGTALAAAVAHHGADLGQASAAAGARYVRTLRPLLLDACVQAIHVDLAALRTASARQAAGPAARPETPQEAPEAAAQDEVRDLLRAYQMLGGALEPQPEVVVRALIAGRRWFRAIDPAGGGASEYRLEALARRQLDLCAGTLLPAGLLRIDLDRRLVEALNRELGEGLWIEQAYDDLIRRLTPKFALVEPATLPSGTAQAALTATHPVSLVYSQGAWDATVQPAIEEQADQLVRTLTGLRMPHERAAIVSRLGERFLADHQQRWLAFIGGIRAAQVRDFRDTPAQITRICGPDSPYPQLITYALDQLALKTGAAAAPATNVAWVAPCLQAIAGLRQDALAYQQVTQDGRRSTDVERLKVLVERFNAVSLHLGDVLTTVPEPATRTAIHQGFESILHSLFAALDLEVAGELDRVWSQQVATVFTARLGARYPFARDAADEVPMGEFEAFFNPVHGTLWSALGQIETMRGIRVLGRPSVTLSDEYERMLRRAQELRALFFAGSAPTLDLAFTYRMQQRESVRDLQVQFGAKTSTLYERPDARYQARIRHGESYHAKIALLTVTGQWKSSEYNHGDWGFLRLLRAGNPKPLADGGSFCTWEHDGSIAGKAVIFKASLILESGGIEKAVSGDLLSGLDLPQHILRLETAP